MKFISSFLVLFAFSISANAYAPTRTESLEQATYEVLETSSDSPDMQLFIFDSKDEANAFEQEFGQGTLLVDAEGNIYYAEEGELFAAANDLRALSRKNRNCEITEGEASYYGGYWHGKKTATGEIYDQNSLTAAHRTLRFGSIVRVTYKGRSVDVRINNAGPFIRGRVIDLSRAAAEQIGLIQRGHAPVEMTLISCGE